MFYTNSIDISLSNFNNMEGPSGVGLVAPMLNPILKSVHFLDYLNFWALLDFFLW